MKNDLVKLVIVIVLSIALFCAFNKKTSTKKEIVDYFNSVLETQRLKMEDEITSNIKHSLKNILQTLN